jgi:hypothetical protein
VVVKSVEVDISVRGDADAKAKLDAVDARAEALKKSFPAFALKIDSAAASEKLKVFRAEMADAAKDRTANIKVKVDDSALQKLQKSVDGLKDKGGPSFLGPLLALTPAIGTLTGVVTGAGVALAGTFAAGGAALGAFGAIAVPVLTSAKTAAAAVQKAQDTYTASVDAGTKKATAYATEQKAIGVAYAELSPAQIALSKQLGDMGNAWQAVKAAQTPVVAGALQPWLQSVTDLTKNLAPIIAKVSPVIQGLGTQFSDLIDSPEFKAFRDFIANTGSNAVLAGGGTLIDFIDAFITLLPKFNPLIQEAVGWIAALGPAALKWSASKKAADDIQAFMQFFTANGPAAGEFLKNVGGALKALAPGLTSGGATELQVLSDFFGWVAKLPPSVAKPLAEVAGVLLTLNKLGVFSVGVKIVGATAGWITRLLGGATVDLGAAGMQKAGVTMAGAAVAMQKAADTMAGAGAAEVTAGGEQAAAGTEEVAAGGLMATGLGGALTAALPALGALTLALVAYEALKSGSSILNYFKPGGGAAPALNPGGTTPGAFTTVVPQSVAAAAAAQNATAAASPQGQGTANLTAQGKLVEAYALNLQSLDQVFTAQAKTAATAQSALDTYTASVKASGTQSQASRSDAALLVSWLEGVGVSSGKARADVAAYTTAIAQNGITSSQAQAARLKVVSDILAASSNARQGQLDLSRYTAAVQDDGAKSQAAQSARAQLIKDLENTGLNAQDATSWVDGLGTSVKNLPDSKTIKITMDGSGLYTITGSVIAASQGKGGSGNAAGGLAAGGFITGGIPGRDSVLIRAMPGELVVPVHLVAAGAVDHLRGMLPGFASGGTVSGTLTPGFVSGMSGAFTQDMTDAMVTAMRAAIKAAAATAAAASAGGASAGMGGVSNASGVAALKSAAAKHGWTSAAEWAALNNVEMREAGYSLTAKNPGSGAYGMAQFINGPSEYAQYGGNATTYAGQATAMANYIAQRYGDPIAAWAHEQAYGWYRHGGLIPGYASGGTVASQGAAYLKGWRKSAGTVNAQIDHWTHEQHLDSILAGAAGLSKTLHAKYAKATAADKKTLAGLTSERTVMRDWRTQLGTSDTSLTAWIGAAGKIPSLKANVAAWKKQLAGQKKTIGNISAMLGLTGAQIAADDAAAKAAAAAAVAAAATAAAASASGGATAGTTAASAAATTAAAVPLTPAAALSLLTGGTGTAPAAPGAFPALASGALPWSGWSGASGGQAFPWPGWGDGQGQPGTGAPGGGAGGGGGGGGGGGADGLLAELRALRSEIRNLTGVAAAIPQKTGQHVGGAINGAAAAGSFRNRYP